MPAINMICRYFNGMLLIFGTLRALRINSSMVIDKSGKAERKRQCNAKLIMDTIMCLFSFVNAVIIYGRAHVTRNNLSLIWNGG